MRNSRKGIQDRVFRVTLKIQIRDFHNSKTFFHFTTLFWNCKYYDTTLPIANVGDETSFLLIKNQCGAQSWADTDKSLDTASDTHVRPTLVEPLILGSGLVKVRGDSMKKIKNFQNFWLQKIQCDFYKYFFAILKLWTRATFQAISSVRQLGHGWEFFDRM